MGLKDKNGKEIKVGHELSVPLDVFSTGVVILDKEHNELALELKYESKKVHLNQLHKNLFESVEVLN
jgi:hypothetical protein